MLNLPLLNGSLVVRPVDGQTKVFDPVRRRWLVLTPEEHVRQLLLLYLTGPMKYPKSLIAVEKSLDLGHIRLRFDAVIYERETHRPWMLVECKAPEIALSDAVLQQLLRYHSQIPSCGYWLITNGHQAFCADASDPANIVWLNELPSYAG